MKTSYNYLSFLEYYSDWKGITEITFIFFVIISSYTFYRGYETGFFYGYPIIPFTSLVMIAYSSIIAATFAQRIESGRIGNLFTMPIDRKRFLYTNTFIEALEMSMMFSILLLFLSFIETFQGYYIYVVENFFFTSVILIFMISVGKIIGAISKNALLTSFLTLFIFYFMDTISYYFHSSDLLYFIFSNFTSTAEYVPFNSNSIFYLFVLFLISLALLELMSRLLMQKNLKNGR